MNGPEHYREAESCLVRAQANTEVGDREEAALWAAQAQAHAHLAAVAAHLNSKSVPDYPTVPAPSRFDHDDALTWKDVIQ